MAKKGCKICHAVTLELDSTGRCASCAAAKAATDAGATYGKFLAAQAAREEELERKKWAEYAESPKTSVCAWCGEPFNPRGTSARYCCPECRETAHREMAKERYRKKHNLAPRLCLHCGKPIAEDVNWLMKTCSKECQKAHRERKKKEYAARYRAMKREEAQRG